MRSARSPVFRPCCALIVMLGSKPRAKNSTASASRAGLSPLFTTRITGASARRRRSATSWSSGASPACASTTKRMRSASSTATRAWSCTRSSMSVPGSSSRPPVSTTVKVRPFHSAVP
jgi:hypothetical protein